jgi:hypothetical protein
MQFGSAIFSLSLLYAILIWGASVILFHIVHIIYLLFNSLTLIFSFKTYYLIHYFGCNLFNLF